MKNKISIHSESIANLKSIKVDSNQLNFLRFTLKIDTDYGMFVCNDQLVYDDIEKIYQKPTPFGFVGLKAINQLTDFVEYELIVYAKKEIVLRKISLEMVIKEKLETVLLYDTFKNASAFGLIRMADFSVLFGFSNPIFGVEHNDDRVNLFFEPSLILNCDENFICDRLFIGAVPIGDVYIQPDVPVTAYRKEGKYHTRYRNPSGHIALNRDEIRLFKKYADYYLGSYYNELQVVFYTYFCPFPRLISTDEEESIYYQYIDNFKSIGGDLIIFNPIERFIQPVPTLESRWVISQTGSRTKRILEYCRKQGIGYGFTWGSAVINTNSPMTSYTLIGEKNHWKKVGKGGELSRENCICSEDFYEWFKQVQINTINEEQIKLWDWDPGPGIGSFCYSPNHGHIPGKGFYKGYRKAMQMIADIKSECPGLVIQSFHGLKEYGLWGMKGIDWHESYWEQDPYFFAASYPDFSADRYTASGMRMQCWWNHNFQFLPSSINQFMSSRMIQNCGSPSEFRYLFDFYGYEYALMSALACGGSITFPMLPYDFNIDPEYANFMKKWIAWGRKNYHLNKNMYTFGSQVKVGGIDGYAKWQGDKGLIFLCNPGPFAIKTSFEFGDEIGFKGEKLYSLQQLYPCEGINVFDEKLLTDLFKYNDLVHITVPAFNIIVLKVEASNNNLKLLGMKGDILIENNICFIDAVGIEGQEYSFAIKGSEAIKKVLVNNEEQDFIRKSNLIIGKVAFGNNLVRNIEIFNNSKKYQIPFVIKKERYKSNVFLSKRIQELLIAAEEGIPELMNKSYIKALSHNLDSFLWTCPNRLYATLSFKDIPLDSEIELIINGKIIALKSQVVSAHGLANPLVIGYYADITDFVCYDDNNEFVLNVVNSSPVEFYGIQLYYPEGSITNKINKIPVNTIVHNVIKPNEIIKKEDLGRYPEVTNGWIREGYIEEYRQFTLCVSVNLPYEDIEGVYCSNSINIDDSKMTLMTDNFLNYDFSKGLWTKTFYMGSRQFLIVDDENINVWVVSKNGSTSKTYKVRTEWKLI